MSTTSEIAIFFLFLETLNPYMCKFMRVNHDVEHTSSFTLVKPLDHFT